MHHWSEATCTCEVAAPYAQALYVLSSVCVQLTVHVNPSNSKSFSALDAAQMTAQTAAIDQVKAFFRWDLSARA